MAKQWPESPSLSEQLTGAMEDLPDAIVSAEYLGYTVRELVKWAESQYFRYKDLLPALHRPTDSNWCTLLPWHYDMLVSAREAKLRGIRVKQFTLLPLASLSSPPHITIDTRVLHQMLKKVNFPDVPTEENAFREQKDIWWPKIFKMDGLLKGGAKDNYIFENILKTDGVSTSFIFTRKEARHNDVADPQAIGAATALGLPVPTGKEWATPLVDWPELADVDPDLVVGADPGRRDMVTVNRPDHDKHGHPLPDIGYRGRARRRKRKNRGRGSRKRRKDRGQHGNRHKKRRHKGKGKGKRKRRHGGSRKRKRHSYEEVSFSVSMNEWRINTGSKVAEEKRKAWMKKDKGQLGNEKPLWDVLTTMPSAKVATVEDMQTHCDNLLTYLPRILNHNMKRRVRRLAFHGHIRRTAALDDLCHRMTGGKGMDAVVVFGACRCSSGFGYFPGPIMQLRQRLELHTRVVILHEHYTSQRCSKCAFAAARAGTPHSLKLLPGRAREPGKRANTLKKKDIHGVRWCSQCKTTWNRDVNSARSMRQVFLWMLNYHLMRPEPFRHVGALSR